MFSEWLAEQDNLQQTLTTFFQKVKAQILSSMQAKNGYVIFRFPQDYESLFETRRPTVQLPQPQQQPYSQQLALAAHTLTPGTWITEDDKKEDPHGKGGLAFRHVADKLDWEPKQILTFKKTMQKSIQRIGKDMGLLFELYVYIHLIDVAGLNPIEGKDSFWAYSVRDQYMEKLQAKVSKASSPLILQFLELHSKDMAEKMKAKASLLLKCSVDSVKFSGGEDGNFGARKNPADIIIGCGQKMVGFNLKFTSETKIHVASLAFHSAYALLGGKRPASFQQSVEEAGEESHQFVLGQLWELSQQYENQPNKFTKMLNYLLSGSGEMPVVPAMRNYTRNRGNAEWSGGIELDFIVKDNVLFPKPGATILVQSEQPKTYVQLTYKVKDGTPHGTSVFLEPNQGKVNVKVNNLTSAGGRGY